MTLEELVSRTNEFYFLREFTFSTARFCPPTQSEVELADAVIWLDDLAVVFQVKERSEGADISADAENRWFENKVVGKATRQVRNTLNYLNQYDPVSVTNNYGQTVPLSVRGIRTMHKVIVYLEKNLYPVCRPKFHLSRTAGLMHLIPADDYMGIVRTLLTFFEISEYLSWRAELCADWPSDVAALPEQSLVGHYLRGEKNLKPQIADAKNLEIMEEEIDKWDVTGILHKFLERTTDNEIDGIKYHRIIREVAKLHRGELKSFKERFALCMEAAKADEFRQPYRFVSPRTGCGFVFIPLQSEFRESRRTALINLTAACKYDLHLDKCIGLSFVRDVDGWFVVDWCFHEAKWEFSGEIESILAKSYPFRPVKEQIVYRYPFKTTEN
jgi:hypothetical protein